MGEAVASRCPPWQPATAGCALAPAPSPPPPSCPSSPLRRPFLMCQKQITREGFKCMCGTELKSPLEFGVHHRCPILAPERAPWTRKQCCQEIWESGFQERRRRLMRDPGLPGQLPSWRPIKPEADSLAGSGRGAPESGHLACPRPPGPPASLARLQGLPASCHSALPRAAFEANGRTINSMGVGDNFGPP